MTYPLQLLCLHNDNEHPMSKQTKTAGGRYDSLKVSMLSKSVVIAKCFQLELQAMWCFKNSFFCKVGKKKSRNVAFKLDFLELKLGAQVQNRYMQWQCVQVLYKLGACSHQVYWDMWRNMGVLTGAWTYIGRNATSNKNCKG